MKLLLSNHDSSVRHKQVRPEHGVVYPNINAVQLSRKRRKRDTLLAVQYNASFFWTTMPALASPKRRDAKPQFHHIHLFDRVCNVINSREREAGLAVASAFANDMVFQNLL